MPMRALETPYKGPKMQRSSSQDSSLLLHAVEENAQWRGYARDTFKIIGHANATP